VPVFNRLLYGTAFLLLHLRKLLLNHFLSLALARDNLTGLKLSLKLSCYIFFKNIATVSNVLVAM